MLRSIKWRSLKRLQSTIAESQHSAPASSGAYTVPAIEHIDQFKQQGIPGLFSAKGLENAWYKRAEFYVKNLNKQVEENQLNAGENISELVEQYSKSSTKIDIFNNASLLFNTNFAISSLGAVRGDDNSIPVQATAESLLDGTDINSQLINEPTQEELVDWIDDSFGSVLEFKTLLLNSSLGINGDGFTWLVARKPQNQYSPTSSQISRDEYDSLFVLNTYNSGTPNNSLRYGQLSELASKLSSLAGDAKSVSSSSILPILEAKNISMFSDVEYFPVLAIDASPKSWLLDYGVFGKAKYLEQTWKAIDWDIVSKRLPKRAKNTLA